MRSFYEQCIYPANTPTVGMCGFTGGQCGQGKPTLIPRGPHVGFLSLEEETEVPNHQFHQIAAFSMRPAAICVQDKEKG